MPSKVEISIDLKNLDRLNKFSRNQYRADVGIFSSNNKRNDTNKLTNAEIGARHEYGVMSENLPRRSFLKDPLTIKGNDVINKANELIKKNLFTDNGTKNTVQSLGMFAESIVVQAFETGGFGTWTPLSYKTISEKGHTQILLDTLQLKNSIASRVKKL